MFGRGKKNTGSNNSPKADHVRSHGQNLFGMPDLSEFAVPGHDDPDVSNEALEAELAALLDEEDDETSARMQRERRPAPAPAKQIKTADPLKTIEAMAAEAMKDDIDDEDDDDDDDALLAELEDITSEPHESPPTLGPPASAHPASAKTPSPSPRRKIDQVPSPAKQPAPGPAPSNLAPSPSAVKRSPSPARRPQPPPETSLPSTSSKIVAEPTDLNSLLQQRGILYQQAIKHAETAGEGSKVRRYKRQLKTIVDLQKKLKQGKPIAHDEIPPEVYVPQSAAADSQPPTQEPVPAQATSSPQAPARTAVTGPTSHSAANQPSTSSDAKSADSGKLSMLSVRRDQYKMAAVLAKRSGDMTTAANHLKVAKQFDAVIHAIEAGEEVDLSEMPPPPHTAPKPSPDAASRPQVPPRQAPPPPVANVQESSQGGSSPQEFPRPKTDMEALLQRRTKYKSMADQAKEEKNDSKARRIGRIVKSYEDTIRKHKLGKPVDFGELASLPEFPPFPSQSGAPQQPSHPQPTQPPSATTLPQAATVNVAGTSGIAGTAGVAATGAGQVSRAGQQGSVQPGRPPPPARQMSAKESMYQRNISLLKDRIMQYKRLALVAKKKGDMYEAKRLLKIAKEIELMLSAAESGLPVNIESIPKLPTQGQCEENEVVSPPTSPEPVEDFEMLAGSDSKDVYQRLISTLNKQIEICKANASVYEKLGNVKSVKRFQEYEESCQQDLDVLTAKQSRGEAIPRHHYEQRTLPSVRVCPDVKETEAEIVVVQGLQLHCPNEKDAKDIDTYIKVEFPYPSDESQSHKTGWAKGADQPQYNSSFMVEINRNSRAFNSAMKRKALKLEVIYSKGLLRGHKTLGTASLKLAELDSKCELHESLPLMDGRKEIGGKIEVKVRIHHPLTGIKEDFIKEKWLIIDSVHKKTVKASSSSSNSSAAASSSSGSSHRNKDSKICAIH